MREFFRRPSFLFLLALLARLPALLWHERWNPDSLAYLYLGGGLWRGHLPGLPVPNLVSPPGCALALGWISFFPVAWQDSAGYLAQAMFSAALVFPLYALTRRRFGLRAATWAAFLAAFAHPFILSATQFQAESVYLLALLGGIALLERRDRLAWLALPLLPLAALTRGEGPAVVLAALFFMALRARANRKPAALARAALCAGACLLALGGYAALFRARSGILPWGFYFRNAAGVGALSGPGNSLDAASLTMLRGSPARDFIAAIAHRLPGTIAHNAVWWFAGMLPGALFVFWPALPLGLWRRLQTLRRARLHGLDPLDGAALATAAIFLIVWRARHHAPMGLAPLIPLLASTLSRYCGRWPKLMAALIPLWLLWAGVHATLVYREYGALPRLPGVTLARRLGAREIITDDLPALDESGRDDWLGAAQLPLLSPGANETDWRALAATFPRARFALHNSALPMASPPAEWPQRDCEPGLDAAASPVCADEIRLK